MATRKQEDTIISAGSGGTVDSEFVELLFRQGKVRGVPALQPSTPEEALRLERLARAFAGGTSVTEIVREDRGSVLP